MSRPQWTREKVEAAMNAMFKAKERDPSQVNLVAVRGYYEDSMGVPNQNDRGIFDDAVFLISPTEFVSFNFNTDPSRSGFNENAGKGFAVLQPGVYAYKLGIHGMSKPKAKQYIALIQHGAVVIKRDRATTTEKGFFGINIHRGGINGTSSEGCQTVIRDQWPEFIALVESEMEKYNQTTIPYCLTEQQG